jgi:N-acetylmuramoyl-L-alanine amidase
VVIDAGHGGADIGNRGIHSNEKDDTLKMALVLSDALKEKGFKVVMTRTTDMLVTQGDRVKIANDTPKSIFISLQFNSGSSEITGIETLILTPPNAAFDNKQDTASVSLAAAVHASVISRFKFVDRGMKRPQSAALIGCERPGILFEGGFVTNDQEGLLIASDTYRQNVSAAIADAVVNFHKALETAMKPAR